MKFFVISIFPEIFKALNYSILGKAIEKGIISVECINPRDFTSDKHKTVDDEPYGGGAGMVMKPEPLVAAIEKVKSLSCHVKVVLLSPKGKRFDQKIALELAREKSLCLLCGRYEGVDERVTFFVDEEISIGDYVLSGGEYAALCVIDAVSRLVPGVLGSEESLKEESFSSFLLEYPHYTRPPNFREFEVPQVLLSGNHALISDWRRFQQLKITFERRPDLLAKADLDDADKKRLLKILKGEEWSP